MNEGSDPPATLPADLVPPSKRSSATETQPETTAPPPKAASAAPSSGIDYSALSDLSVTDPNVGGFSDFSNPVTNLSSNPSITGNLITPPTPQAPLTSAPVAPVGPNVTGPIPNLLTGGGKSVPAAEMPYLVTPDKFQSYCQIFQNSSDPATGVISAMAARDVFLQSGLPNSTLAQVWNLSDANQAGSLNCTQFVLAMHLLAAVLQGKMNLSHIIELQKHQYLKIFVNNIFK